MKSIGYLLLPLMAATALPAQQLTPVGDDARVRITAPQLPAPLFGRVELRDRNKDLLVITTPGADARVSVPLVAVQRIDVSRGRRRLAGAAIGAGVGFLIGAPYGAAAASEGGDDLAAAAGFLAGGFTGIVFGIPIGFAYAPERWNRGIVADPLDQAIIVSLRPGARVKRFSDGTVAVKGERDRRRGIIRGAIVLGGIGLVFGGSTLLAEGSVAGSTSAQ